MDKNVQKVRGTQPTGKLPHYQSAAEQLLVGLAVESR
jgi:hypothetical protein